MADHLTRRQRYGAIIFLGLCILSLAAALWRNRLPPEPVPDPEAIKALESTLQEMHYAEADSLREAHERVQMRKATREKARQRSSGKAKKSEQSAPAEKPRTNRSPLDEDIPLN